VCRRGKHVVWRCSNEINCNKTHKKTWYKKRYALFVISHHSERQFHSRRVSLYALARYRTVTCILRREFSGVRQEAVVEGVIRPVDHLATDTSVYIFLEESSTSFVRVYKEPWNGNAYIWSPDISISCWLQVQSVFWSRIINLLKTKRNLLYTGSGRKTWRFLS